MTVPTIATEVRDRARATPGGVAMRSKRFGIWRETTWAQYGEQVELVAHGLLALGVAPGDRVAIQSENRAEWLIADVAAVAVRAITVGVYPTSPAAEVRHVLADSGATVLIAEDQESVDKTLEVKGDLPDLAHVVHIEERGLRGYEEPSLLPWDALLERGREHREAHGGALDALAEAVAQDDVVTLVYTSGTTGPPKGAMLTAANVSEAMRVMIDEDGAFPGAGPADLSVSFLPLAHVADRLGSTWHNAHAGVQLHFGEPGGDLLETLREVQPTFFLAVPRIWEKLHGGVEIRMASASRLKRATYRFWMGQAARIGKARAANGGAHTASTRLRYAVGWVFVYRALRERLGLRRCRHAICGAAPIAPEILEWFLGLGVAVHEIYGMTENAAVATVNRVGRMKLGTVGEAQPGTELRLDEDTGEILVRHPAVFAGYWNREDATAETIDADGWLHTGDVGEMVDGTYLRVVDRLKDIVITAGGKNVSPSEVEGALKASPFIKEAIVIGDERPYLVALIGIEQETVSAWAQRQGIAFTTYADLACREEVMREVQKAIVEANAGFAPPEQVKRFRMLTRELDHDEGELTPTQKVRRSAIAEKLGPVIEDMYEDRRAHPGGDAQEVYGGNVGSPAAVGGKG